MAELEARLGQLSSSGGGADSTLAAKAALLDLFRVKVGSGVQGSGQAWWMARVQAGSRVQGRLGGQGSGLAGGRVQGWLAAGFRVQVQ